ncbi:MAG: hypothetical protein K2X87_06595 [Gemmataceae bacterium]|nr:hypothetical protein [Gemmataceae bacterium]
MLVFGTSRSKQTPGPDIRISCPGCGRPDTPAESFESEERVRLYFIPLPTQRERHVVCRACGADRVTRLRLDELPLLGPDELAPHLAPRVSIVTWSLAVLSVLLFCFPGVSLVLGLAGAVASRRAGGLAFRLSLLGMALNVLLWGGLLLRSAVVDLQGQ